MNASPDLDPADYMLGQGLIDGEHAELIRLINALNGGGLAPADLLHQLQNYAHLHFDGEEELMRLSDYPAMEAHLAQHQEFRRYLAEITPQIRGDQNMIPSETQHYLEQWLLHHIQETDRRLVDFLLHEEWL